MSNLHFSLGTAEDVSSIIEINKSHVGSDATGGFLVVELESNQVLSMIESNKERFFVAKNSENIVVGYVQIADDFERELLQNMTWFSLDSKSLAISILDEDIIYIKQLAVRSGFMSQGVGTFLYRNLETEIERSIVVFAADKPKQNLPSIKFHEANNFVSVGRLTRSKFGEFSNYESIFYVKKIGL